MGTGHLPPLLHILLIENNPDDLQTFQQSYQGVVRVKISDYARLNPALDRLNVEADAFDVIVIACQLAEPAELKLLQQPFTSENIKLPIIVLGSPGDESLVAEAIETGADGYVIKDSQQNYKNIIPAVINNTLKHHRTALARIKAEQELEDTVIRYRRIVEGDVVSPSIVERKRIEDALKAKLRQAEARYSEIRERDIIDEITKLYTRQYFHQQLHLEAQRAQRHSTSLALILLDLDNFKAVNEDFGFQVGNEVLSRVASRVLLQVRATDIVARYDGDQISVILPETSRDGAIVVAEKLRQAISAHPFPWRTHKLPLTASLSVTAATSPDNNDLDQMLETLENGMAKAKKQGRNKVVAN